MNVIVDQNAIYSQGHCDSERIGFAQYNESPIEQLERRMHSLVANLIKKTLKQKPIQKTSKSNDMKQRKLLPLHAAHGKEKGKDPKTKRLAEGSKYYYILKSLDLKVKIKAKVTTT